MPLSRCNSLRSRQDSNLRNGFLVHRLNHSATTTSAACSVTPSLHAFIQESDPVHQKGGRGRHLGGERLSSVSPHTKGKLLSEVGFEPSALDRSAILTARRANLERVRARSGLYRSCSEIRPPSEAQRDALSGTNPLALEWTFYLQAVQSYASLKYEWKSARNMENMCKKASKTGFFGALTF